MDVIGTVTSVIDLFVVVKGLVDKYNDVPKAVVKLKQECEGTRIVCVWLKQHISKDPKEHTTKDGRALQDGSNERDETLTYFFDTAMSTLEKTLKGLRKRLKKVEPMRTRERIEYMLKESYFEEASQDVIRQRGMVDFVLKGIQLRDNQRIINLVKNNQQTAGTSAQQAKDLQTAVQNGKLEKVNTILARGDVHVDIALGKKGDRALHIAARKGFLEIVRRLLTYKADVNIQNDSLDTPLHLVLQQAEPEMSTILLSQGADWKKANGKGLTPLHVAVQRSVVPVVQYLLDRGADPNVRDSSGQTPLLLACSPLNKSGNKSRVDVEVIRMLLKAKADPTLGDQERGRTPIHELAHSGSTRGLKLVAKNLKEAGKSVDLKQNQSAGGQTPLELAIARDKSDAVDVLVTNKANVNAKQTMEDGTKTAPLWHAAKKGNLAIVTMLLKKGAKTGVADKDYTKLLQFAVKKPWFELAQLLLQPEDDPDNKSQDRLNEEPKTAPKTSYAVNVDAQWFDKNSLLHVAVFSNDIPMAQLLLSSGAAVDPAGKFNGTPFMFAAQAGSLPMMRLLLAHGAAWSHTTPQGTDAFVWACSRGQIDPASFLLGCGQNLNVRTSGDYTALHYAAARSGKPEIVQWLLNLGVDTGVKATKVRAPFKAKGTAAEVAKAHGATKIAKLIDDFQGSAV